MKTKEVALEDLKTIMPFVRHAVAMARQEGQAYFGILTSTDKGEKKLVASLHADEFISDLCTILGLATENTSEENSDAEALKLAQTVARTGGQISVSGLRHDV